MKIPSQVSLSGIAAVVISVGVMAAILVFGHQESQPPSTVETQNVSTERVDTLMSGLDTPWTITHVDGVGMIVSERSGRLSFGADLNPIVIDDVTDEAEGGLMGIVGHPDFATNHRLYMYYTTERDGKVHNRVSYAELRDGKLGKQTVITDDIPASSTHNGGALAFGPDGKLYITNGDAAEPSQAQDRASLAGKILRVNDDGTIPQDNPFGTAVWSYGHRNPQGIAWDDNGTMWSVEHGPSTRDELNRIVAGGNYGWPTITGDETHEGMISPVKSSGDETWAPSRLIYTNGKLYFTGLRGEALFEATVEADAGNVSLTAYFKNDYGRLRALAVADGYLYFGTSNRDGRGSPIVSDDRIMRVLLQDL